MLHFKFEPALQWLPYKDGLTQLHLMIQVGGLTTYAAGNRAVLVRFDEGEKKSYAARLDDLIKDADLSANEIGRAHV